jgi:hypothetical protein
MNRRPQADGDADLRRLVALERQGWSDANRLAPGSLRDFQTLADEAFRDMLRKYDRPSDLGAAMKQRAGSARRPKRSGPRAR